MPQSTPTVDSCEHSNDSSSSKRTFNLFIHLVITLSTKPPKKKSWQLIGYLQQRAECGSRVMLCKSLLRISQYNRALSERWERLYINLFRMKQ